MEYKGYMIEGDGTFGYKEIRPVGRGSVPNALRGQFTTSHFAQRAIDILTSQKEANNGKAGVSD